MLNHTGGESLWRSFAIRQANPGTPILYLAGGPGTSGIDYATSLRFEP